MNETSTLAASAANFNWLMTSFVDNTVGVEQGVVVSSDGMPMAVSGVPRGASDRLAAIVTGVRSLSEGTSQLLRIGVLQNVIVEMRSAYLLVAAIGGGSTLGIVCAKSCDLGLVGYEMALLVDRVGAQLTPELITELKKAFD